jgi:uncharacterized protein (TIGR03000 family)
MPKITTPKALLVLVAGVLLGGLARGQTGEQKQVIVFTIRLPADAALTINDHLTRETGSVRTYQTPPLSVGGHYAYNLKATSKGKEVTRKIHLAHGMDNSFDLRAEFLPAAKATVHPKQFTASAGPEMAGLYAVAIWGMSLRTVEEALDTQPPDGSRFPN